MMLSAPILISGRVGSPINDQVNRASVTETVDSDSIPGRVKP